MKGNRELGTVMMRSPPFLRARWMFWRDFSMELTCSRTSIQRMQSKASSWKGKFSASSSW